jgi:hypothetical protein
MDKTTSNGDFYFAATKTIAHMKPIPIILSGGVRGSNAELWGMDGNAPGWGAYGFGAIAFPFKIKSSSLVLAAEAAQQPNHPADLPTANIPDNSGLCCPFYAEFETTPEL